MPKNYEWNEAKNRINREKHGIGFETARHVFDDPNRLVNDSPRNGEARWKTVGLLFGVLFTVVYTLRRTAVRLISARRASRKEVQTYHNHNSPPTVTSPSNQDNHE